MGYQYYHCDPPVISTILFAVLFALSSAIPIWQIIRPRTRTMIPFIVGALFEAHGYVFRYIRAREMPDWTMKPYVGQQVLILLGPALLAVSVYMLFGGNFRLLNTSSISPTRVNSLSKTFVPGDVISFMPGGGGGGILASAKTAHKSNLGHIMILLGLLMQIIFFGLFIFTSIIFHRRNAQVTLAPDGHCHSLGSNTSGFFTLSAR